MTNEAIIEACPQWIQLKFIDLRGIKNVIKNILNKHLFYYFKMRYLTLKR